MSRRTLFEIKPVRDDEQEVETTYREESEVSQKKEVKKEMKVEGVELRTTVTGIVRIAGIIVIAIIVVGILVGSAVVVPTGSRGLVLTWGQVTDVRSEGLSFIIPIMQRVEFMDVTIQKAEATESVASQDLQEVTATIAVNFRLNPAYVKEIYTDFRQDYKDRIVIPNIDESLKAATALFRAEELITKRSEVKLEFEVILKDRLGAFNIEVVSVQIRNYEFSKEFTAAIEAKVTAEQKALEAKNKLEQIRYEAQQQVIQAEAYYNATVIRARADSEAFRLRKEQLDPLILQWIALEKWDGKLPYYLGSGAIPFILLPTNSTGK